MGKYKRHESTTVIDPFPMTDSSSLPSEQNASLNTTPTTLAHNTVPVTTSPSDNDNTLNLPTSPHLHTQPTEPGPSKRISKTPSWLKDYSSGEGLSDGEGDFSHANLP